MPVPTAISDTPRVNGTPLEPGLIDNSLKGASGFHSLPDLVYKHVPPYLSALTDQMKPGHSRDLFLLGMLPILGGLTPNTLMSYGGEWVCTNLYCCILAPTGAGKNGLMRARRIGETLHKRLHAEGRIARREWANTPVEEREEQETPAFPLFYCPADASAAGIKDLMVDSPHSVMFTTEAKTLAQSLASDWGGFRDILLKSYHNEPVEVIRKYSEPIYIPKPALGMILSGTPGSFEGILTDTEDGLYSRFMFYYFESATDVFGNMFASEEGEALDRDLQDFAERVPALYNILRERESPLFMTMSRKDQARVVAAGQAAMEAVRNAPDANLTSNVRRAGLNVFRIASLFTILDRYMQGIDMAAPKSLECHERYVTAGISIAFSAVEHAIRLSDAMYEGVSQIAGLQTKFVQMLPEGEFDYSQAMAVAKNLKIAERTARNYLGSARDRGQIIHLSKGRWEKPKAERTYVSLRNVAALNAPGVR